MNTTTQIENLDKSLRKAFSSVARDVERLRGRDNVIREELNKLADQLGNQVARDEFFKIVRRIDDDLKKSITPEELEALEDKMLKSIQKIAESPAKKVDKIQSEFKNLEENNKNFRKEIDEEFKVINDEFASTQDLKKEVKEVSKIKKSLLNLDERYAQNKKLDTCFDEIDEIYDIIENIESAFIKEKELDKFKKEITDKLQKFDKRVKVAEEIEEELVKKTKSLYDISKDIEGLKAKQKETKETISKLDNTKQIEELDTSLRKDLGKLDLRLNGQKETIRELNKSITKLDKNDTSMQDKIFENKTYISEVNLSILKEINKLDNKIIRQGEKTKEINDKLNDIIKIINKDNEIKLKKSSLSSKNYYEDESKELKGKIKKLESQVSKQKKSTDKTKSQPEVKSSGKTVWMKVVDWFTEEVDDEEMIESKTKALEDKSRKKQENKKSEKTIKSSNTKKTKRSKTKKNDIPKKVNTKPKTKDNEEENKKNRNVWMKIVDWFTEEIDEEE